MENAPALYVVPTPLGNLGDISQRAIETLHRVDYIAAEDTRHTALLLKHLDCKTRLIAAHQHNEEEAAQKIIAHLVNGESIALVSDAGTPAISDPGARIVARVHDAGFRVIPLPGACAAITALSASGLTDPHFLFYGFLPPKANAREDALKPLIGLPYALIFYEAPHRILATVEAMQQIFGANRRLVIAREITKLFETILSAPLAEALDWLRSDANHQRGEFVLILAGAEEKPAEHDTEKTEAADNLLRTLLAENLPTKQVARIVNALTGIPKNALYERALELGNAS